MSDESLTGTVTVPVRAVTLTGEQLLAARSRAASCGGLLTEAGQALVLAGRGDEIAMAISDAAVSIETYDWLLEGGGDI